MGVLAVALAAFAAAAPTASSDPEALAAALAHDAGAVVAASFVLRPDAATTAVGGAANATTQPLHGATVAYLSDGDATAGFSGTKADNISHDLGTTARGAHDVTVLSLRVAVPEEANCLTLGATYFSEDYSDDATDDPAFFDSFLAELDPAAPWAAGTGGPSTLTAPANFARVQMPDGLKPVSAEVHSGSFSTQHAFGTAFDGTSQWHTFKTAVTPGEHVLELSILDRSDGAYDSTVLVDDLRAIRRRPGTCTFPARDQFSSGEDLDAPPVTIAASGGRLSGTAGTHPNDADTVSVRVGPETYTAPVAGDGSWSLTPTGLEGTYAARASQVDTAGNEGRSAEQSVTIAALPAPEPTASPTASPQPTATPAATASPPIPESPAGPAPSGGPSLPAAGATPVATARCRVPKLRGKTLKAAVRALRRAGCRLGRISRKRSRAGKRGRAIAQTPRAGARRPGGTRVKLTLRR